MSGVATLNEMLNEQDWLKRQRIGVAGRCIAGPKPVNLCQGYCHHGRSRARRTDFGESTKHSTTRNSIKSAGQFAEAAPGTVNLSRIDHTSPRTRIHAPPPRKTEEASPDMEQTGVYGTLSKVFAWGLLCTRTLYIGTVVLCIQG